MPVNRLLTTTTFARPAPAAAGAAEAAEAADEASEEKVVALKKTIADMSSQLETQGAELDKAKGEIGSLERDRRGRVAAVSEAKRALEEGQELEMLRDGLQGIKAQLKAVTRERDDLLKKGPPPSEAPPASTKVAGVGALNEEVANLKGHLEKRNNEFANLEKQLEASEQQAQTMLHQEDVKHREVVEHWNQVVAEKEEAVRRLTKELELQTQSQQNQKQDTHPLRAVVKPSPHFSCPQCLFPPMYSKPLCLAACPVCRTIAALASATRHRCWEHRRSRRRSRV